MFSLNQKSSTSVSIFLRVIRGSFIVKILDTGMAFYLQVFLARLMGTENYGQYVLVVSFLSVLVLFAKFGFDTLLLRYIAEYEIAKKWQLLKGIIKGSRYAVIFLSVFLVSLVSVILPFTTYGQDSQLAETFRVGLLVLPFMALAQLQQSALISFKHVMLALFPQRILNPLIMIICSLSLYLYYGENIRSSEVMSIRVISTVIAYLLSVVLLHRYLPNGIKKVSPKYMKKEWFSVAIPLFLTSGMYVVLRQMDVLLIDFFLGTESVSLYFAADRIASLMTFGLVAINLVFAPIISQLYSSGQKGKLQHIISKAAILNFIFSLIVFAILTIFGRGILKLFGPVFVSAYVPLLILLIGHIAISFAGSTGYIMSMTGHQKEASFIIASCVVLKFGSGVLLIPVLGINGAAITTSLVTSIWIASMSLFLFLKININSSIFLSNASDPQKYNW